MIVCKVCGATNEQGATFCGTCGAFLEWSGESVPPDGGAQPGPVTPGVPPPPGAGAVAAGAGAVAATETTTTATPAGPPPDAAPPGSLICSNCGQANDPTRVFCSRCATELSAVAAPVGPVTVEPPPGGGIPPIAIAGAIGAVALLAVLAFVFVLPKGSPAPSSGADLTAPPSLALSAGPSVPASAPASAGASASAPASTEPSSASPSAALPSPTGQIVFTVNKGNNADLFVWSADDQKPTKLIGGSGNQSDASWSPDASKVVYLSNEPPFNPNQGSTTEGLRIVKADGSDVKVPDFTHHDVDRNPAWSPDGKLIAFASNAVRKNVATGGSKTDLDIFTRPLSDNTITNTLTTDEADDYAPAWSPDGSTIAFVSKRDGDAHLFTMDADGKHEALLDLGAGIFDSPAFSPDGKSIAFTMQASKGAPIQLFVASASDGSGMHQVGTFDDDVHGPTWSPDSKLIAVAEGGDGSMIVMVDAATGSVVGQLGVNGATNTQPDWK